MRKPMHEFLKIAAEHGFAMGFTSVMIDGSALSFADNVALTKEIVTYAHQYQISVEAELGHVGQGDIAYDFFTQPKQAEQFVQLTNVDALAVAIGTAHGLYKQVPQFDLQRLVQINNTVNIPLVLHGGSSSGAANLQAVIKNGITKINLFTDLGQASLDLMKQWLLADDLPALLRQYPDFNLKKANIHQMLTFGFTYGYKLKLIDYITLFKSANTLHLFQ